MSRGSSGLGATHDDPSAHGLGISAFDSDCEIRFGTFDEPVRAADVRRRNRERQERYSASEEEARRRRGVEDMASRLWRSEENRGERGRRRSNAPYPETNLIPTETDPEFLEAMIEGRRGGG